MFSLLLLPHCPAPLAFILSPFEEEPTSVRCPVLSWVGLNGSAVWVAFLEGCWVLPVCSSPPLSAALGLQSALAPSRGQDMGSRQSSHPVWIRVSPGRAAPPAPGPYGGGHSGLSMGTLDRLAQ